MQSSDGPERIGIIGCACRLPGGIHSPEDFWDVLVAGENAWSETPKARYNERLFHRNSKDRQNGFISRGGHWLREPLDVFDAAFFRISAAEARAMDPQQRISLEVAYEALENAGIPLEKIAAQQVGVFVGGSQVDYRDHLNRDPESRPAFQAIGTHPCILSNRISYAFDLRGPSLTVDTACSSSLTALHLAVQSIRAKECSIAIVGACHLNVTPDSSIEYSRMHLLSEEGRSYAFDSRARSGFGRGEGAVFLVLKSGELAFEENDNVRAIIRNTGIGCDGRTVGITHPSEEAQESLIRSVYSSAGLDQNDTDYVEAHGTGTAVGDPIEIRALQRAFNSKARKKPLRVGSAKASIGHLEGAAGLASVLKSVLMTERQIIPPNGDFIQPNPDLDLNGSGILIPVKPTIWPQSDLRRVSISSYGYGGAGAHAILEQSELTAKSLGLDFTVNVLQRRAAKCLLFVLSANQKSTAEAMAQHLSKTLRNQPDLWFEWYLANIAYTLEKHRSKLDWRIAIPAHNAAALVKGLSAVNPCIAGKMNKVAFVFSGQGAQWPRMGHSLRSSSDVFKKSLDQCNEYILELGADWSLIEELDKSEEDSRVHEAIISQPACTALQIALVDTIKHWGLLPSAVIGHSSGEIAAAYAAGVISMKDAVKIAYSRGLAACKLREDMPQLKGSMAAVASTEAEVNELIECVGTHNGKVAIACFNSPTSMTVSGDTPEVDEVVESAHERSFTARKLRTEVAYHSYHMAAVAKPYKDFVGNVSVSSSRVRFFSSLYGKEINHSELQNQYWVDNLVRPVKFSEAFTHMIEQSHGLFDTVVELGPHAVLKAPIVQCLRETEPSLAKIEYLPSIQRGQDASRSLLSSMGNLWSKGYPIDLHAINFGVGSSTRRRPSRDLPQYPWNHSQNFWHTTRVGQGYLHAEKAQVKLLGARDIMSADSQPSWRYILRLRELPWLMEHKINDQGLFPLFGYVYMAVQAFKQTLEAQSIKFRDIILSHVHAKEALVLVEDQETELVTSFAEVDSSGCWTFRISSWAIETGWILNCEGLIEVDLPSSELESCDLREETRPVRSEVQKVQKNVNVENLYRDLNDLGCSFGPLFQSLKSVSQQSLPMMIGLAQVQSDNATNDEDHFEEFHPAFLESLSHICWATLSESIGGMQNALVPFKVKRIRIPKTLLTNPGTSWEVNGSTKRIAGRTDFSFSAKCLEETQQQDQVIVTGMTMAAYGKPRAFSVVRPAQTCSTEWIKWNANGVKPDEQNNHASTSSTLIVCHTGDIPTQSEKSVADAMRVSTGLDLLLMSLAEASAIVKTEAMHIILDTRRSSVDDADPLANVFDSVKNLVAHAKGILWITTSGSSAALYSTAMSALFRVLRIELSGGLLATLSVEEDLDKFDAEAVNTFADDVGSILTFLTDSSATQGGSGDYEFERRHGNLQVPRLTFAAEIDGFIKRELGETVVELLPLSQSNRRLTLRGCSPQSAGKPYLDDDETPETKIPAHFVEFKVDAVQVFHDSSQTLRGDCCGTITSIGNEVACLRVGDRICAIDVAAFGNFCRLPAHRCALIPPQMSSVDCAVNARGYCVAYYALKRVARFTSEDKILVVGTEGVLCKALLMLAKAANCEIFVSVKTTTTEEQRETLLSTNLFPDDHIFLGADSAIQQAIMTLTGGKGVDVILDVSKESRNRAIWKCCAPGGQILQVDSDKDDQLLSSTKKSQKKNVSMFELDVTELLQDTSLWSDILPSALNIFNGFPQQTQLQQRISRIGFSEFTTAIASLRSGKEDCIFIVEPQAQDQVLCTLPPPITNALSPNASYLITGGTGGLGKRLAMWMAEQGAKHVVLASRRGEKAPGVQELKDQLQAMRAELHVHKCDISESKDVAQLVEHLKKNSVPPIRGVIHGAVVLRDMAFESLSHDDYTAVLRPKLQGALNLHHHTSDLDFFTTLSSVATTFGNRTQSAYAAAGDALLAFTKWRRALGLRADILELGPVQDIGVFAENSDGLAQLVKDTMGHLVLPDEVVAACKAALVLGPLPSPTVIGLIAQVPGVEPPYWMADNKFEALRGPDAVATEDPNARSAQAKKPIKEQLKDEQSSEQRYAIVREGLVGKLAHLLVLSPDEISDAKKPADYGIDSLVAIDLRAWVYQEIGKRVAMNDLLNAASVGELAEKLAQAGI